MSAGAPKFDIPEPTKEQIDGLKKLFDALDKNHNGKIEENELKEILQKQHIPTDHVSLIFKLSDKNGDGGIDFQELCNTLKLLAAAKAHPEGTCEKLFEKIDVDHSGFLDENEVFNFLNFFSPGKVTKEHAKALIGKLDSDGDGKLSFEECLKVCNIHK